ncbi:class I SAM-dependent methyltransferase [Achromobacter sp. GG226]|uniref:class I SAM-dependent methyltransferase n=1 Tax=Verticiella alkaliphila TaxID=2779529 RepID=UPI001C0BF9F7|nr:class I SAM-dependent methyltransferase [Verticiella sp. GG226]MBU4612617.1 class I SAM-dependent methyltransferase [Verticiella sp. GG226]
MTQSISPSHDDATADQYGQRANAYVSSAVHAAGADLDQIEALARSQSPERALDLGCGGGHVAYRLAECAQAVVAVDLAKGMLSAVAAEAATRGLGNLTVQRAGAEALPMTDASVDFLASRYSAHHWRDAAAGLAEARRVLVPGGVAVFADVVAPEAALLDSHLQTVELLRDGTHVRDYSVPEWVAMLGRARFAVRGVTRRRLRLDFATWIARTHTPEVLVQAIRAMQQAAPQEVQAAFAIEADGSFTVDTVTLEAVAV